PAALAAQRFRHGGVGHDREQSPRPVLSHHRRGEETARRGEAHFRFPAGRHRPRYGELTCGCGTGFDAGSDAANSRRISRKRSPSTGRWSATTASREAKAESSAAPPWRSKPAGKRGASRGWTRWYRIFDTPGAESAARRD